jgi:hypothetical protein
MRDLWVLKTKWAEASSASQTKNDPPRIFVDIVLGLCKGYRASIAVIFHDNNSLRALRFNSPARAHVHHLDSKARCGRLEDIVIEV